MLQMLVILLLSQQALQPVAQGVASYYTVESSGLKTASGDLLDNESYTCAMRNGEFGSYYLVVGENGRAVVCRLNDRGPYIKGRVIDLSEAAMKTLQSTEEGKLRVKVYKITMPDIAIPEVLQALLPGDSRQNS